MEGFVVYERLRHAIAAQIRDVSAEASIPTSLVSVLMGLPVETLASIRADLFREIIFLPPDGKDWVPLIHGRGSNEGLAFSSVEQVYEVLGRAMVVNFPGLLQLLGHALRLLLTATPQSAGTSAPVSSPDR